MLAKTNSKIAKFSLIESLTREVRDPYEDEHFRQALHDVEHLEQWMKENDVKNGWTLTEKLAFLRNIESTIRTGAAVRRTQLAWFALGIGAIAGTLGLMIGLLAR